MEFLYVLGIVFGVFASSFLLINIKAVFGKGNFRGSCAQNNPMLKGKVGECSVCGKKGEEVCQMPELKTS